MSPRIQGPADVGEALELVQRTAQGLDPSSRYVSELLVLIRSSRSLAELERRLEGLRAHQHSGDQAFFQMSLAEKLVASLLTPESEPFRFSKAEEEALAQEFGRRSHPVRLLSVPCSRGYEVFSLASYAVRADASFELLAMDHQPCLIETAWQALEAPAFDADRAQLTAALERGRAKISFQVGDVRALDGGDFDLVFCRNLLGYFVEAQALEILQRLWRAAAPGSWIFLDDFCFQKTPALRRWLASRGAPLPGLPAYALGSKESVA